MYKIFTGGPETEEQTRLRFQVELEFVQCLANPNYLNCKLLFKKYTLINIVEINSTVLFSVLAQRGYFKDQAFVNYLKYLLYWKEPDYAKFIK